MLTALVSVLLWLSLKPSKPCSFAHRQSGTTTTTLSPQHCGCEKKLQKQHGTSSSQAKVQLLPSRFQPAVALLPQHCSALLQETRQRTNHVLIAHLMAVQRVWRGGQKTRTWPCSIRWGARWRDVFISQGRGRSVSISAERPTCSVVFSGTGVKFQLNENAWPPERVEVTGVMPSFRGPSQRPIAKASPFSRRKTVVQGFHVERDGGFPQVLELPIIKQCLQLQKASNRVPSFPSPSPHIGFQSHPGKSARAYAACGMRG